eukprot:14219282-Alexandrium_andersonii.AAC.1
MVNVVATKRCSAARGQVHSSQLLDPEGGHTGCGGDDGNYEGVGRAAAGLEGFGPHEAPEGGPAGCTACAGMERVDHHGRGAQGLAEQVRGGDQGVLRQGGVKGWKAVATEVKYCTLVERWDKNSRRLELNSAPNSEAFDLFFVTGLAEEMQNWLKRDMTHLPCAAPPGDPEHQLRVFLDKAQGSSGNGM